MVLLVNGPRHSVGHFELLGAVLVIRQPRSNATVRAQDVGGGERHSANLADNERLE
jgi:hypothetical protein